MNPEWKWYNSSIKHHRLVDQIQKKNVYFLPWGDMSHHQKSVQIASHGFLYFSFFSLLQNSSHNILHCLTEHTVALLASLSQHTTADSVPLPKPAPACNLWVQCGLDPVLEPLRTHMADLGAVPCFQFQTVLAMLQPFREGVNHWMDSLSVCLSLLLRLFNYNKSIYKINQYIHNAKA